MKIENKFKKSNMEKIKYIIGNKEHAEEIQQYFEKFAKSGRDYYNFEDNSYAYFIHPDTGSISYFSTGDWTFKALVEAGVFEELKYPYVKPKLQVIQGVSNRGSAVIKLLESLGGVNVREFNGCDQWSYYYIDDEKEISRKTISCDFFKDYNLEILTLPEKVEKPKLKVIKGVPDRSEEVIALLESLGGVNIYNFNGHFIDCYYFIDAVGKNSIYYYECDNAFFDDYELEALTLPEEPVKPKLQVIQGDPDRGEEVIKLLESLGGKNTGPQSGNFRINYYYINELNDIEYRPKTSKFFDDYELEVLTLPEKIVFIPKLKVIKGNPDRGDEVIKMLETLGGYSNNGCDGTNDNCYYFVNPSSARCDGKKPIMFFSCTSSYFDNYDLEILTLPKKVEKPKLQVIQGDPDRGNDVIDLLRGLGGINMNCLLGKDTDQYYYINDNKIINCTSFDSDVFKGYNLEVLTLPVKGGYNKKSETTKFVPFVSKVLVRTNPGSWWIPAFYFSEETEGSTCRYRIVGSDSTYRECIPYEGNEELAFTWDNPEDI